MQNNKGTKEAWKIILATITENKELDIFYSDKNLDEVKHHSNPISYLKKWLTHATPRNNILPERTMEYTLDGSTTDWALMTTKPWRVESFTLEVEEQKQEENRQKWWFSPFFLCIFILTIYRFIKKNKQRTISFKCNETIVIKFGRNKCLQLFITVILYLQTILFYIFAVIVPIWLMI